jgi:dicarboxylate transporter 10
MVREEGASSLTRGMGPNVFRAVLMNASQLASYVSSFICHGLLIDGFYSYDFFKAELLKTRFFKDDIYCHFTASFAAVRILMGDMSYV